MTTTPRRPRRATRVALVGLVLALGACTAADEEPTEDPSASERPSSSPSPAPTPTSDPTPTTLEGAEAAYDDCMKANGSAATALPEGAGLAEVAGWGDLPDDALVELGLTRADLDAHLACWPDLEPFVAAAAGDDGGTAAPAPTEVPVDAELAAQMHAAVECLVARGWDLLEPGVETGPLTMEARDPAFDWEDESFLIDQWDCQQEAGMIG